MQVGEARQLYVQGTGKEREMTPEEKEERIQRALDLHKRRYNCAQCVACACADVVDADEAQLFRLVEGFGGGMGRLTETCGALSGGVVILGLANSDGCEVVRSKGATYQLSRRLVDEFDDKNGSTRCGEIKGLEGGPVLRSCNGCIEDAVRITLDILEGERDECD